MAFSNTNHLKPIKIRILRRLLNVLDFQSSSVQIVGLIHFRSDILKHSILQPL